MTANFTLRDFFSFFLTGCIFLIAMLAVFYREIFEYIGRNSSLLSDFSSIWLVLLVPEIYLVGHLFGTLSYLMLRAYARIERRSRRSNAWLVRNGLGLAKSLLFRQRVGYAIEKSPHFKNKDEFWSACALLQVRNTYAPAEYWCYQNEFFSSVNIVFVVSCIVSFCRCRCGMGVVFLLLSLLTFYRAKLYAGYFVSTVDRLLRAHAAERK